MSEAVPDFTRYLNEVQRVFETYNNYDDRTAHDNSIKVGPKIDRIFQSIAGEIFEESPFEAKTQALSTTIEIAEWIMKDRNTIGHDKRQDLPSMDLEPTISQILDMLLPEELAALQADGEISKALRSLRGHARKFALDLGIDRSIDRPWLAESDQEDEAHMAL